MSKKRQMFDYLERVIYAKKLISQLFFIRMFIVSVVRRQAP
jgi:hypothetical protein